MAADSPTPPRSQATSTLSTSFRLALLGAWTVTALIVTALNVANANRRFTGSLASASLLTFLVSHVIVAVHPQGPTSAQGLQKSNADPTIAHFLVRAGTTSRVRSLVLLLFACTWLFDLMIYAIALVFATLFGGIMLFTVYYGDPIPGSMDDLRVDYARRIARNETNAPKSKADAVVEFHQQTGIDITQVLNRYSPWLLLSIVAIIWANFFSLCLFVGRHAWNSLWAVLSAPPAGNTKKKKAAGGRAGGKREVAPVQNNLVFDGWHKM